MTCCPKPASLETIPTAVCKFDLKQIQKVVFQRDGFTWVNLTNDITALADWQILLAAAGNTKVVASPLVGGEPIITAGEMISEGGGNESLNGIEENAGTEPSVFTAVFKSLTPAQEKSLQKLACEDLSVYFVNQDNKIIAKSVGDDWEAIKIQSLFVSDRHNEGFGSKDRNTIRFALPAGWSNDIDFVTPAPGFNPLADLV